MGNILRAYPRPQPVEHGPPEKARCGAGRRIWSFAHPDGINRALVWDNGDAYYGPVNGEDRSGFGIWIGADGTEIEGTWESDHLQGMALVIQPGGYQSLRRYAEDRILSDNTSEAMLSRVAQSDILPVSHPTCMLASSGSETPQCDDISTLTFGRRVRTRTSTPPLYSSSSSTKVYIPRAPSQVDTWVVPFEDLVLDKRLSRHKCPHCSTVYKGMWLGKDVIVRVYSTNVGEIDSNLKQLLTRMARVRHPNIALFMAAAVSTDKFAIVTEFVYTNALAPLPYTAQHALHVAKGIAVGCSYLRRQGFAHKNLKPSNVLIDSSTEVKLTDYFIEEFNSVFHRGPCTAEATVSFVAPESLRRSPFVPFGIDTASDVFSFGMLCWTLIAGREPYCGLSRAQIRILVGYAGYREPRVFLGNLSALTRLIDECLAQDPLQRPTFERLVVALNSMHSSANSAAEDALITFISGR